MSDTPTTRLSKPAPHRATDVALWLAAIVAAVAIIVLAACSSSGDSTQATTSSAADTSTITQASGEYASGKHHATIVVGDYGTIKVELDADVAPITVANFCQLAEDGFYDDLTFHRVISGFMIQGGDPNGDGTGGSTRTIMGEFSANGVVNAIQHKRGVISMARSSDYDSASSQFFIMHADYDSLDGSYAAFGHVTEGMEVVDAICEKVTPTDDNGTVEKADQPVISSITIDD